MFLLDTDFLIATRFKTETTHARAVAVIKKSLADSSLLITDLVLFELASVLSHKFSHTDAVQVTAELRSRKQTMLTTTQSDIDEAWDIFNAQKKNKCSFVDCANVAVARNLGLLIVSFDAFYRNIDAPLLLGV